MYYKDFEENILSDLMMIVNKAESYGIDSQNIELYAEDEEHQLFDISNIRCIKAKDRPVLLLSISKK